jgi:MFS family permease
VFIAVGLPGLGLAALVALTVREPQRREVLAHTARAEDEVPSLRDVLNELFVRNRFCLAYFAAYVALITLFYSHAAWFPTLLMRRFHLAPNVVGQMAAPAYMIGGMLGVACAGMLATRVTDETALRRVLGFSACAVAVLVPAAIAMPLVSNSGVAVLLYGTCAFAASIAMGLAPVPLQIAMPNRMRGRSLALLVFMTNAISGGVGPLSVGYLNERLGQTGSSLGMALAVVGGVSALASAVLYTIATRRVPAANTR